MKRLRLPGTEENVSKFFVIKEKSSLDHVCCDPEKIKYDIAVASPLGLGSSSASSSSLPVMEDVTMAENNFISINGMSRETAPISQTLKRRISVSSHRGSTMCGPTASKELSHYQSMSPVAQPIAPNNLAQPIASNNVRSALGGSSSLMNTLHSMNAGGNGSNGINAIAHFANYTPQSLAQQPAAVQAFNESVAQHNLGGGLSSVSSSLPPPRALSNLPSSAQRGNDSDSSNSDDEDDLTMAQTLSAHVQQQSIEGSSSASLPLTADIINHNNINNGHGLSHSQQLYLMDNRNAAARNNVPPLSRVSIYSQPHGLEHQIESYHMMTGDAVSGPLLLKGRRTEIEPQRVDQSHLAVEDRSWITRSEAKADLEVRCLLSSFSGVCASSLSFNQHCVTSSLIPEQVRLREQQDDQRGHQVPRRQAAASHLRRMRQLRDCMSLEAVSHPRQQGEDQSLLRHQAQVALRPLHRPGAGRTGRAR
jgi:hypothetical protein